MAKRVAIITPSYKADYDRCVLLCDSIDANVSGVDDHYILVDNEDFPLFSGLASQNRHVIAEGDILPGWLYAIRSGIGSGARKLWVSARTWPLRGWHVQQLRRIAIAAHCDHDALLYCDSDMFFVRPFDASMLWRGDDLRLYRKPNSINSDMNQHCKWLQSASRVHGLGSPLLPHDDYINNLVSWRRKTVLEMCKHIETLNNRDWISAICRSRTFSECLIYGLYADGVLKGNSQHWHAEFGLCRTYWNGDALDAASLSQFVEQMDAQQFAVGIQSFTNTDTTILRRFLEKAA